MLFFIDDESKEELLSFEYLQIRIFFGGYKLLYIKVSITVFVLFLLFLFMPNTEETDKSKSINNAIRRDKEKTMEKEGKKNENEQK